MIGPNAPDFTTGPSRTSIHCARKWSSRRSGFHVVIKHRSPDPVAALLRGSCPTTCRLIFCVPKQSAFRPAPKLCSRRRRACAPHAWRRRLPSCRQCAWQPVAAPGLLAHCTFPPLRSDRACTTACVSVLWGPTGGTEPVLRSAQHCLAAATPLRRAAGWPTRTRGLGRRWRRSTHRISTAAIRQG